MSKLRRVALLSCAPALVAGCDSTDLGPFGPQPPTISVSVSPIPLPDDGTGFGFEVDLHTFSEAGTPFMNATDLSSRSYGHDGALTYIGTCAAGAGRLELAVHDLIAAEAALIEGVVEPGRVGLPLTCAGGAAVALDYAFEMATLRQADREATVAFSDVTCTVTRRCEDAGIGAEVTCSRPNVDGLGLTLGVSTTRLVCGAMDFPVSSLGKTTAADLGIMELEAKAEAGLEVQRWSIGALTTDLDHCHLETRLLAAPELIGGRVPACTAWPVLEVSLPLSVEACAASSPVEVSYADRSALPAYLVIDARGPHAPAAAPPTSCAAPYGSMTAGDPSAPEGYFDLALEVHLPNTP